MKKICLMLLWVICLSLSGLARAETPIGLVDMNQVIQQSAAGAAAMKELSAFKEQKNKGVAAKEKNLQGMRDQINQKMSTNPKDAGLPKLQKDFQDAVQAYNKLQADNQAEIQNKDRDLTHGIIEDVSIICNDLKREKGYAYIFDKGQSGIIVFPPENDLTPEVIKRYDAKYRARKK